MEIDDKETRELRREQWSRIVAARDLKYVRAFEKMGLMLGDPLFVTCPECRAVFWIRMPKNRPDICFDGTPCICCTQACGCYGELETFRPEPAPVDTEFTFDTILTCHRCDLVFASNGIVIRRPCCGIENPREVISDFASQISATLKRTDHPPSRAVLEGTLGQLVATFDGVMRRMVQISNKNIAAMIDRGEPLSKLPLMQSVPAKISFQNLEGARQKLIAAGWNMSDYVDNWSALVKLFQKRHLCAHALGIVDEHYIEVTGDREAHVGKKVSITTDDIVDGTASCVEIVNIFFGHFLS